MIFIEKTSTPPECLVQEKLKKSGNYNCVGVHELLCKDFFNKCYICGIKPIQDGGEIEHLIAHKGDIDKKFDWDNLFLSCGHCNSVKNANEFNENIINCTKVDPSNHIRQEFKDSSVVVTALDKEVQSITTAKLIEKCFNVENTSKRFSASYVRTQELSKEMNIFYRSLAKYRENQCVKNTRQIRALLKNDTIFTAFKRDYLRLHNLDLFSELV